MVDVSDYIKRLQPYVHEENPAFLFSALKELAAIQQSNGSWYGDVTITAFIARSLLKTKITGWNFNKARAFIKSRQREDGFVMWPYNEPNAWATTIVTPALFELSMRQELAKANKMIFPLQSPNGCFVDEKRPWLTARFVISLLDSGYPAHNKRIKQALEWLKDIQFDDGSWKTEDFGINPCFEVTSMSVVALIKGGIKSDDPVIQKSIRFLNYERSQNGSWGNDSHFTAHAIEALFYGQQTEEVVFQSGLNFLRNSIKNWGESWEPHSVGEIFYILSEIIDTQKTVSMPLDFAVSEMTRVSEGFEQMRQEMKGMMGKLLSETNTGKRPLKKLCLLTGGNCSKSNMTFQNEVFVGFQFKSKNYNALSLKKGITEGLDKFSFKPFFPDEHAKNEHITCKICERLQNVSFCIFDLSDINPNVMLELGLACGLDKKIFIIRAKSADKPIPSDLKGIDRIEYDDPLDLREKIFTLFPKLV
jgi:hypothetical protein